VVIPVLVRQLLQNRCDEISSKIFDTQERILKLKLGVRWWQWVILAVWCRQPVNTLLVIFGASVLYNQFMSVVSLVRGKRRLDLPASKRIINWMVFVVVLSCILYCLQINFWGFVVIDAMYLLPNLFQRLGNE
jgi:hypothetical protein